MQDTLAQIANSAAKVFIGATIVLAVGVTNSHYEGFILPAVVIGVYALVQWSRWTTEARTLAERDRSQRITRDAIDDYRQDGGSESSSS